jgi:hypothetical protein
MRCLWEYKNPPRLLVGFLLHEYSFHEVSILFLVTFLLCSTHVTELSPVEFLPYEAPSEGLYSFLLIMNLPLWTIKNSLLIIIYQEYTDLLRVRAGLVRISPLLRFYEVRCL